MKNKLLLSFLIGAVILSSGCGNENNNNNNTATEPSLISTETEQQNEQMLRYKDKIVSKKYYEYMLSMNKYDFLDTYINYANEYAARGLDFGMAYFGTEVADTEEFWDAKLTDESEVVTVSDIVKKQTLTFAKCAAVFDDIMDEHGLSFSDGTREKAESALRSRTGENGESVFERFGVTRNEALYAELISVGIGELKESVCREGGPAEIPEDMVKNELKKNVRYQAISFYGSADETKIKASDAYDRIMTGKSSFDEELKNSDDYAELTGDHKDGTVLSKEEFCLTFGIDDPERSFEPNDLFIAENRMGSYVIRISEWTGSDRQNAYDTVQSEVFSDFLRSYTSKIDIDEDAVASIDFFMAARIAP